MGADSEVLEFFSLVDVDKSSLFEIVISENLFVRVEIQVKGNICVPIVGEVNKI